MKIVLEKILFQGKETFWDDGLHVYTFCRRYLVTSIYINLTYRINLPGQQVPRVATSARIFRWTSEA